jgi:signal peptidase I
MQPNFWNEQRLLVNKVVYKLHEPERGDVIIFHPPQRMKESYIKRIIGLPGESVTIENGVVKIHKPDGSTLSLDEPYIEEAASQPYIGFPIPENEYFVLGDNRNNTNDSRNDWRVPLKNIIGKAWLSYWPPDKWGLAANYPFKEQIARANN